MRYVAGLLLVMLMPVVRAQRCPAWNAVYYNARILTGVGLAEGKPEMMHSMAVDDGRIVAVAKDDGLKGCGASYDMHGAFIMPGFDDAHTHMAFAGKQRMTVDLDNVPSLFAMQEKVKAFAAVLPKGAWVTGGGWDQTKWASGTLPTRQDLDAVSDGHPAYLERTDGHIAVLNSAALRAAGITEGTKAPLGGAIDVDASGEPTGIVRDTALNPVRAIVPKPDAAMRRKALELAMQDAVSHGVTSVQDFSEWDDFLMLEQMEKEGALKVRWAEWMDFNLPVATLQQMQASHPKSDPWLHTTMLKGFMDGSLGSRTAAMAAPYADDPKNSGLPRYDQPKLNAMATEREAAGFQLGFHAIGDRANAMALDAFAVSEAADIKMEQYMKACKSRIEAGQDVSCLGPARPLIRNRIEHAQVLLPKDFERFAELDVIASMQPSHLLTDMAWAEQRIGPERAKYAYAWRSMLDHHVRLAFGTDYPVESIDPMRGLYAATTRMNVEATQTFHPEQKITMDEALYAYTQGAAYAEFAENVKGTLEVGKLADFVVLDHDLTQTSGREILKVKVLRTVVGGKVMYDAGGSVPAAMRHGKDDE